MDASTQVDRLAVGVRASGGEARREALHRRESSAARLTAAWSWMVGVSLVMQCGGLAARAENGGLPKGTNVASLVVISESNLANPAQKTLVATLQGLVARQSAQQIYIDGGSGYSIWYKHLYTAYGIPYSTVSSPWSMLSQFKSCVSGYVLYDKAANSNSLSAATSLCCLFNAVAVDASIESTVRSCGITNLLADVRARTDTWIWTNYNQLLSRDVVIEQKTDFDDNLRDYAAMAGAFTFFEGNSAFRSYVVSQMNPDAACLGWGDASQGENVFVGQDSSNGVATVAADWALDLSTLSSVRDASFYQRTYGNPLADTNVHYVTFVMTDGDNVQWNLGGEPDFYNNPARGQFNMGWSLSPALADLAPSVLRWHYDAASNGPNRDFFVAGPSGAGYFYPSQYPPAALARQALKLNDCMGRADMNLAQIIDFSSFSRLDLWNKYLAQPNIDGLLYLEYSPYSGAGGAMEFATNGKPVIACRDLLWSGIEDEGTLIANLKSYPRDPASPSGYTFVSVIVWGKSQANVQQVVTNLPSDVRVVTPDVFAKLVRNNVGRRLAYDFGSSLQGWTGGTSGKYYDRALWTASAGNPTGALLLDGSDLGHSDGQPNSWFSRQIILPANATTLAFDTSADNDGLLRARLQLANGNFVTLIDWAGLSTPKTWVQCSADLSAYAGQTVTLWFEQNDGGQGSGEYRYVDNVAVQTAGAPVYLPSAPKLLTATGTGSVSLSWRDNDVNESGFSIERSLGSGGAWGEIARLGSNVTTYADASIAPAGGYAYRIRSWNAAGFSPYSNVRTNSAPAPRFAIGPLNGGFESGSANWSVGGSGGAGGSVSFGNSPANGLGSPGANCVLETSDGSGTVDFRSDYFSLGAAANGARPVTFSFDYNILNAVKSGNQIRVGLRFEDANGGFLAERNSYIGVPNGDTGASGWKHFSVTAAPSSTALNADIRVSMNVFGDDHWTGGAVLFDNFVVVIGSNTAPAATSFALAAMSGMPVTLRMVGGAQPQTDADGDLLTVSYAGQASHGAVSTDGQSLTYVSAPGYSGADRFTFAISDGVGGVATATATVRVNGPGLNQFGGPVKTGSSAYALSFSGAPGCSYVLEWTGSLVAPVIWTPQWTNTADANGLVLFTNSPAASAGFWRSRYLPIAL